MVKNKSHGWIDLEPNMIIYVVQFSFLKGSICSSLTLSKKRNLGSTNNKISNGKVRFHAHCQKALIKYTFPYLLQIDNFDLKFEKIKVKVFRR